MSNAGYGNHDEPPPPKATDDGKAKSAPAVSPPVTDKDVATPGDGAGPEPPVGKDVDPGVG